MSVTDLVEQKALFHDIGPASPYPEDQCFAEIDTHVANFKSKQLVGVVKTSWQLVQMADLVIEFENELHKLDCAWGIKDSDEGSYVARDYIVQLPHTGEVGATVRLLMRLSTGYDGSHATKVGVGTLDLTCSNGMVTYKEISGASKKHTKSANMDFFKSVVEQSTKLFGEKLAEIQTWRNCPITIPDSVRCINELSISDKLKKEIFTQLGTEIANRGKNIFALVSAYTAYASGNGIFKSDKAAHIYHNRQAEVSKWTTAPRFKQMMRGEKVDGPLVQDIEWFVQLRET
jgi:hypothetical protein